MHTVPSSWQSNGFDDLSPRKLYEILRLRQQVFGVEQDCLYQDMDGLDQQAMHLCGWADDTLLAPGGSARR